MNNSYLSEIDPECLAELISSFPTGSDFYNVDCDLIDEARWLVKLGFLESDGFCGFRRAK